MEAQDKLLFNVEQLKDMLDDPMFRADLEKVIAGERGSKAAAFRARRFTVNMEKLMKTFRKLTIESTKK